ncbi:MAG: hypothetical protein RBS38_03730 [Bacteroidales bacterium]|jgi:hypothetical protein|nr:hypothetical protein [Bacteroidales bacterium]
MKKTILWILAIIITLGAAYYQRKTGPTNPRDTFLTVNDSMVKVRLVRSLGLDERPEVRLAITDTAVKARLFYRRYRTGEEFSSGDFVYKVYPVNSMLMNKVFGITEEKGLYAAVPQQPPAGKIEYYLELTDSKGTTTILKETPVVIRFKGAVPSYILTPHIIFMFLAMLLANVAGLMALFNLPAFRKYSVWTLITLIAGGMILGPAVQKFAFGEFWTGVPFGWDLTDNKTLIALLFWILAVVMNKKRDTRVYTLLAAAVTLIIFSIPHSMFGSELDYSSGEVTQGIILLFLMKISKNS